MEKYNFELLAFESRNLSIAINLKPDCVLRNEDGSINLKNQGLLVKLFYIEIAMRGSGLCAPVS